MKKSFLRLLILLFFGSLGLGQFLRIQLNPSVAIYGHDIILGFIYLLFFLSGHKIKISSKQKKLIKAIKPFIYILIFSLLINIPSLGSKILIPSMYLARVFFYLAIFPITASLIKSKDIKTNLNKILLSTNAFLVFGGLVQYFIFPDTRSFRLLGWDDHLNRSIGTLLDPNFFGLMLVLGLVLLVNSKIRYKKIHIFFTFITFLLTYSRASYLSLLAAGVVFGLQKGKTKQILIGSILFISSLFLLPRPGGEGVRLERTASIFQRIESQRQGIDIFLKKPLFGIGFNSYKLYTQNKNKYDFIPNHPSSPDNSYLLILATTGIFGIMIFTKFSLDLTNEHSKNKLILPSLFAVGIHAFFNNSIFYPWVLIWIVTLLAQESSKGKT
ncbi:O-antigen ligase family protein [Patescibacteria group bacterium]